MKVSRSLRSFETTQSLSLQLTRLCHFEIMLYRRKAAFEDAITLYNVVIPPCSQDRNQLVR